MRFSRFYLEITNRCNLSCSFCPKTKRPARTLTAEEFRLLAELTARALFVIRLGPFLGRLGLEILIQPQKLPADD